MFRNQKRFILLIFVIIIIYNVILLFVYHKQQKQHLEEVGMVTNIKKFKLQYPFIQINIEENHIFIPYCLINLRELTLLNQKRQKSLRQITCNFTPFKYIWLANSYIKINKSYLSTSRQKITLPKETDLIFNIPSNYQIYYVNNVLTKLNAKGPQHFLEYLPVKLIISLNSKKIAIIPLTLPDNKIKSYQEALTYLNLLYLFILIALVLIIKKLKAQPYMNVIIQNVNKLQHKEYVLRNISLTVFQSKLLNLISIPLITIRVCPLISFTLIIANGSKKQVLIFLVIIQQ